MRDATHVAAAEPVVSGRRLEVPSGSLEALKWIGAILMVADHVNKVLLNGAAPALFDAGRLVLPIFTFVLAANLARPGAFEGGMHRRMAARLLFAGAIATPPFLWVGGLGWGWWPLNIMFTLLCAVGILTLLHRHRPGLAFVVFLLGGAFVEFWWPSLLMVVAAWFFHRRPGWLSAAVWLCATASLVVINDSYWALAAIPLLAAMSTIDVPLARSTRWLYWFYPVHLALLCVVRVYLPG